MSLELVFVRCGKFQMMPALCFVIFITEKNMQQKNLHQPLYLYTEQLAMNPAD